MNAYNGGVRGNNSLHSINIFLNKVLPLKPDVVVLMHNINDLGILLYEGAYWNRHPTRSPLVSLIEQEGEPKRTLWRRTRDVLHALLPRLYVRAVRLKGRLAGAGPVTDEWGHLRDEKIDYDAEALRASFRTNLILFVEIARATGVEPVLMAQANRIIDDPDPAVRVNLANVEQEGLGYPAFKKLYDRFNDIIREVGEQRGVQVIDLERAMPKERRFLYDSVHFNDAGSELAASVIAEQLSHRFQPEP